ncbi:hypothetical protein [Ralstonia insidiosa]|uniref:hypothetical protein n=1 Tax=Ralstonia insidiosa TaxID=190721 RepID=UPI000CEE622E|nr:hypothetical protein [Ralstonia insidiosa]
MSADAIKARALAQANGDPYRALEILAQLLEKRDAVVARQQRGIEILEEKIGTVDSVPLWPVDVPDTRARPVGHRSVLARANSKLFPLALEVHVAAVISMMSKAYNTPRQARAARRTAIFCGHEVRALVEARQISGDNADQAIRILQREVNRYLAFVGSRHWGTKRPLRTEKLDKTTCSRGMPSRLRVRTWLDV